MNETILRSAAELYCEVWKEDPWNEYFWVVEDVYRTAVKEISEKNGIGVFATDDTNVIGFTWAYEISKKQGVGISGNTGLNILFRKGVPVYYVSELAVSAKHRRDGIGKRLSQALIQHIQAQYHSCVITLRTDIKAVPAKSLYKKLGFQEIQCTDANHQNRTYWALGS